ncbi:protein of unknown function [Cardinium endosymbiont cEper1 of Encarsia pergandiella]|nr:protein of unknown function [Cardinium endosymbiont cEper1 of Encarsia pergandiella]
MMWIERKLSNLLTLGVSVRKIANLLKYKNHISLNTYINKRKLFDTKL